MRFLNWIDVSKLSFNTLLLLEREQLRWLPGWVPEDDMACALRANPVVEWYVRHKCPELNGWVDELMASKTTQGNRGESAERIRQAEEAILNTLNDLVVYAVDPAIYDALPFNAWDSDELRMLVDWHAKTVIDVGSGTGRLAFVAAEAGAHAVFAVEPVGNLRRYIMEKAHEGGLRNVFAVDGLITDLPFPDGFADVTMGGHVFGGDPPAEYAELKRVTRLGGMIILCPGSSKTETAAHEFLEAQGFAWSWFEEPEYGKKRKYWKMNGEGND
jgi:SAM-dependent methyltransferase